MADEYTTAAMFGNAEPDPSNAPPSEWLSAVDDDSDVKGLVARMATGNLTNADDFKRVMGEQGDTKDPVELHKQFVATTGGPDPNVPVTNPQPPAVPDEIANAPDSTEAETPTKGE